MKIQIDKYTASDGLKYCTFRIYCGTFSQKIGNGYQKVFHNLALLFRHIYKIIIKYYDLLWRFKR